MKLSTAGYGRLSLVPNHGGELLSPSLPNSVCKAQKNQPRWPASSSSSSTCVASRLFLFSWPHLHTRLISSLITQTPSSL